jgi:sulfate adenylyltransferase subunit 1
MVTGASTAQAAVVLIDARKGLLPQSRRHIYLATLLGLSDIIVAINKMDLVGYDERVFLTIRDEVLRFGRGLAHSRVSFIPISASVGDMVVERGEHLTWWTGPTLLEALEAVDVRRSLLDLPPRFPVQLVTRPGLPPLVLPLFQVGRQHHGDLPRGRRDHEQQKHRQKQRRTSRIM